MKVALIKATELINAQMRKKRDAEARKNAIAEERARMDTQAALASAMGGGKDEGDGPDDPDDVLRMICGAGGMSYREMVDGKIVDPESGDGGDATLDRVMEEVKGLRDEHESDALWTHARIAALETALMRTAGLEKRDPSFLIRRPAVQRALRTCAILHAAMGHWRTQKRYLKLLRDAWYRMSTKRLYAGWNAWLAVSVRTMHHHQLLTRSRQFMVVKAMSTWRDAAAAARAADGPTADVETLQIVVAPNY